MYFDACRPFGLRSERVSFEKPFGEPEHYKTVLEFVSCKKDIIIMFYFFLFIILYLSIYSPNDKCLVIRTSLKPHKIYELKRET